MHWERPPPEVPTALRSPVFHPGVYAADLEQHAFYGQQPPPEQRGGMNSSFAFANGSYFESGASEHGFAYPPMHMPFNPSHSHYSPGMPMQVSSELVTNPEAGPVAFNDQATVYQSPQVAQRGNSKRGKRGGKQHHFNQQFNRGGQRYNDSSAIPSWEYSWEQRSAMPSWDHSWNQRENAYYDDSYYHEGATFTPSGNDGNHGREQKRGTSRGKYNSRSRGSHNSNGHFTSVDNSDGIHHSSDGIHHKKKNSKRDMYQGAHQETSGNSGMDQSSREISQSNQGASWHQGTGVTDSGRGRRGRYPNQRMGSASNYGDRSQVSNQSGFKRQAGGEKGNREDSEKEKSIPTNTKNPRNPGQFSFSKSNCSEFQGATARSKTGNGTIGSASRGKGPKDARKFEIKDNDESQRGTLTEQLSSNKYECMVCCDYVRVEEPIWSCQNCYHVFHLSCIKKWAQSSLCKDARTWRCPGCQNESTYIPNQYRCFCGRRKDPTFVRGDTPHSCGESCRRKRVGDCKHPCTILCHPGPCPPCSSMISVKCDCGKLRKSIRCSATTQFKCDQVCDKNLNCEKHKCELLCHSSPCPPCDVCKTQECFCSKTKRTVICGTDEYDMISFSCEKPCGRTLSCGNHVCEEMCHPGECAPCSLAPGNLLTCCCGKTKIKDLDDAPDRQSCLDPVPACGQVCNKPMACGSALQPHMCEKKCHNGECGPCNKETTLRCECGASEKKMDCEVAVTFDAQNPFKCQKRCGKKKTCGRHKCSETCCVRDIHLCEMVCGRKLSCGIHRCEELCHKGNCKRCLQASFDDLTCYCGATVLEPPVPCGTRRPECRMPCSREHECDHEVRHLCHTEEKCPPCTELTEKLCMGGHTVRKNVPCYLGVVSCGYPCHKELPCGKHLCLKKCHKGDCLEAGVACTQPCQQPREACGHPCGAPCHAGDCPDTPCKTEVTITCPCGNRSSKAQCLVGGDLQSSIAHFQRLSVQSMMEAGGQSIDMAQFTRLKKSNKRLDCDTNCAIIERNKRLALALEIQNPDMSAKLGSPNFSEFLVDYAKKNPKFASTVEKSLNDLVQSVKQSGQANKSHTFQPMNRDQRHFVHELAEFYGCQTQSFDYEPNKNVVATAAREKCWLPNVTLVNHALKDQVPKKPSSRMGVSFTAMKKEKEEVQPEKPSGSRAWETASLRPASASAAVASLPSSGASAGATGPWGKPAAPAAPVIDYFDFDG